MHKCWLFADSYMGVMLIGAFPKPSNGDLLPLLQVGDCNKGGELRSRPKNFVNSLAAQNRWHLCGFVVSMPDMGRPAAPAGRPKHAPPRGRR